MGQTVSEKVLSECRLAMLSRIPILFIRTEQELFLRRILFQAENPLVTPVRQGALNNGLEPILAGQVDHDKTKNYKESWSPTDNHNYPFLVLCKADNDNENYSPGNMIKYVKRHEDPQDPSYDILNSSIVILYGAALPVDYPKALIPYTTVIEVSVPDKNEVIDIITRFSQKYEGVFDENFKETLANRIMGFELEEVEICMRQVMANVIVKEVGSSYTDNSDRIKELRKEAEKTISDLKKKKSNGSILELCETNSKIGGMKALKKRLADIQVGMKYYDIYEKKVGVPSYKGILLCGIPGCGKSEAAKFTAQTLNFPLLRLDMGSVMGSSLGESERNIRLATKLAEDIAPVVLWIDEIEKGLSGGSSSDKDSDGGTLKRIIAYLLTWMQEKKKPVFIYATANSIGNLPNELFRSGRFDSMFGVYLPTENECIDIVIESMKRCEELVKKLNKQEQLFDKNCYEKAFREELKELLRTYLLKDSANPRIVIGSDLQALVNNALRLEIPLEEDTDREKEGDIRFMKPAHSVDHVIRIDAKRWKEHLETVMNGESFHVYGDDEENISMIAIRYCRMLRRNFIPTSGEPLFDSNDYHTERYAALKKKREQEFTHQNNDDPDKKNDDLPPILDKSINKKWDQNGYDFHVHAFLYERINTVAFDVETAETKKITKQ